MTEFVTVSLDAEVKEELDLQRKTPMGEVSISDFVSYLLKENKKK